MKSMTNPLAPQTEPPGSLIAAAAAHYQAGQLVDAESAYRAALALAPDDPAIMHNLGVIAAARGDEKSAIALFDSVLARQPRYVSAHYNRALALLAVGETNAAREGLRRTCAIEPGHYEAHRALGFLWLAQGETGRALDHFARTYELRRGDDRSGLAQTSLTHATRDKLLHDAEQFRYLAARSRNAEIFNALSRAYAEVSEEIPEQSIKLSDRQAAMLGADYNTPISIRDAPELAGPAVNKRPDRDALVHGFRDGRAGAVFFDDLLTPDALQRLRSYLLESTIWHDFSHIEGFVASYIEDGLACPLILQIADEIRRNFPELLGAHPLSQAWAFKGLRSASAVDIHADDGAVSVNFWITPTAANLDPAGGGLVVSLVPPPADWRIEGYEADQKRIVSFLEQNPQASLKVPYRENRAVLFESRLFHWSETPKFAAGYENHRINLTFLYGRQGQPRLPPKLREAPTVL
ncbi:MAG TPA: tetratricopeptide repeat protein [Xanthobacteraceae bacterium]|nr:tetratricopeptide repeat protein [Xanthobacteraceae bacterium]